MKKAFIVAALIMFLALVAVAFAEEVKPVPDVMQFKLALGVDNILWFEKGMAPRMVFGAGADVATYQHKFANGQCFVANLHATYATDGTASLKVASAGVTVDVIQLLGASIKLPFTSIKCFVGGTGGLNTVSGKFGGGPIAFLNYSF
jgi:hypothetical protein